MNWPKQDTMWQSNCIIPKRESWGTNIHKGKKSTEEFSSIFHFRYCSRWNTWCLEKVLWRWIYSLCVGLQKSHTLRGVFVNKDDQKWENKFECTEQPFKYAALVGIVAVKKKKKNFISGSLIAII